MNELKVVEVKGQRVLTSKQLAECYVAKESQIKQNFANNRERFVEGKHYISFTGDELRAFKNQVENFDLVASRTSHLYLWTEKGALLHAKSLNTDKAWQVYDYLVDFYFRVKEGEHLPVTVTEKLAKIKVPEQEEAIRIFKILLGYAEQRGLEIKTKDLGAYRSMLNGNRIAIRKNLTLDEVNYELAFELFHSVVNCDKGNMLDTPLAKYYSSQAERASDLMLTLLSRSLARV